MRQTDMDGVHSSMAGRSLERSACFPDAMLYRGRAGDGMDCLVTFDRHTIILSRPVAGLACRIRLSSVHYDAVAMIQMADNHVIRLYHHDPGLSVDLVELDSFDAAEEYRDRLADFLDLPALTMAGGDEEASAEPDPVPAARRNATGTRRPRFLKRRQTGNVIPLLARIAGREMIARH